MRFFRCKYCGQRAGHSPAGEAHTEEGALHEPPFCESYARMTAVAFAAAHADAPSIKPPGMIVCEVNRPEACKENEN